MSCSIFSRNPRPFLHTYLWLAQRWGLETSGWPVRRRQSTSNYVQTPAGSAHVLLASCEQAADHLASCSDESGRIRIWLFVGFHCFPPQLDSFLPAAALLPAILLPLLTAVLKGTQYMTHSHTHFTALAKWISRVTEHMWTNIHARNCDTASQMEEKGMVILSSPSFIVQPQTCRSHDRW